MRRSTCVDRVGYLFAIRSLAPVYLVISLSGTMDDHIGPHHVDSAHHRVEYRHIAIQWLTSHSHQTAAQLSPKTSHTYFHIPPKIELLTQRIQPVGSLCRQPHADDDQ